MADPYIGEIRMCAAATPPTNWAFCDGALLPVSAWPSLFAVLGNTYGGDGINTFALPNLCGRLPMGFGAAPLLTPRLMGEQMGAIAAQLNTLSYPSHSHSFNASPGVGNSASPVSTPGKMSYAAPNNQSLLYVRDAPGSTGDTLLGGEVITETGQTQLHNNLMPSLSVNFIIATAGNVPVMAAPANVVSAMIPRHGSIKFGYPLALWGYFPAQPTAVTFGGVPAVITEQTDSTINVKVPPGNGVVQVVVHSGENQTAETAVTLFTYLPSIFHISPAFGLPEGGTRVTVTGAGLVDVDQVLVGNVSVPYSIYEDTIVVFMPPGQGEVSIQVAEEGGILTPPLPATIFSYAPTLVSISPTFGTAGAGATITVNGFNFTKLSAVWFGIIESPATTFVSDTQLTAVIPSGGLGQVPVSVQIAGSHISIPGLTFDFGPTVTGISPTAGHEGDLVRISGTNFDATAQVMFGNQSASVSSGGSGEIQVLAPKGSFNLAAVTVTTPGGVSPVTMATSFNYGPIVIGLSPPSGTAAGGYNVMVEGSNFVEGTQVFFGTQRATVVSCQRDAMIVTAPAVTTDELVNVTVVSPEGTVSAITEACEFSYGLAVSQLIPTCGQPDSLTNVQLSGLGFETATQVHFGNQTATLHASNDHMATVAAPAGAGIVNVQVSVPGGATSGAGLCNQFSYDPVITSFTPTNGSVKGGGVVTITGASFGATPVVLFDGQPATKVSVVNAPDNTGVITATTPKGSGLVPVTVKTAAGTSAPAPTRFLYGPSITSMNHNHGYATGGGSFTITGVGFTDAVGVNFGQFAASEFTVSSDTRINVTIPAAMPGPCMISVTTSGGGTTPPNPAATFYYGPNVMSVSPDGGPIAGGTLVKLYGAGFSDVNAVMMGFATIEDFSVDAVGTTLSFVTPPGQGSQRLWVKTDHAGSQVTAKTHFNYVPVITQVYFEGPETVFGLNLFIKGTGFETEPTSTMTVYFNGTKSHRLFSLDNSSDVLRGLLDEDIEGVIAVTVSNNWGTSAPFTITI